jgi:calcineurin-like phosphoesterase family protein
MKMMERKIWITSDWHFGHDREFIYKARGFSSIEEMNEAIIERHNSVVAPQDIVYCLGDCMLGDNEKGIECIKRLNGEIHIIPGNHCTNTRIKLYHENHFNVEADAFRLKQGKYSFLATHYPMLTGNLEKESLTQMTLNLYGHTHQTTHFFHDLPYCYHVGMDAHDCYPVSLDTIIQEMKDKVEECKKYL